MSNLPVVIVGAGPTGLMMACELARHGVTFRIFDKKTEPTAASNATWIQTRTLELFDQIGIVDHFIKAGHACNAINFHADGKHLTKLSISGIDSIYPYILMLPQSETEKLLEKFLNELNNKVERSVELIDIKYTDNTATSTLRHANGNVETITSDWLIACDGANSIVREKCGLGFPGENLTEQFIVADATIDFSHLSKDEIHLFFDPGTIFTAFPLGSKKYRIAANLHLDYPRKFFSEIEIIELVQERAHGKYYVTDVAWISPFWIHGKMVDQMRHDVIFLAGDAAHIHSPAGGQGMNIGIQDAINLAWKLALVIQGKAKSSLLDSYQSERYPVVKKAVNENEYFTKMALFDKDVLQKLNEFSQQLSQNQNDLSKTIGMQLTQLDIKYDDSPLIEYNKNINNKSPQPGERFPDISIHQKTLYQFFRNTQHNILLFSGLAPNKDKLIKMEDLQKLLYQRYPDLINIYIISKENISGANIILDPNGIIHERYQIQNSTICILRPDTYISYCSETLDANVIVDFFKNIFTD